MLGPSSRIEVWDNCVMCHGSGEISTDEGAKQCPTCEGKTLTPRKVTLNQIFKEWEQHINRRSRLPGNRRPF